IPALARIRAAGEHAVFRAEPTLPLADEEGRHRLFHRAGAKDGGAPHAYQHAAGRGARVLALERKGTQLFQTSTFPRHKALLRTSRRGFGSCSDMDSLRGSLVEDEKHDLTT